MAVGVVINEFLANNTNSLLDQDGARSDWIELYNTSASAVNLSNYYLTDNSGSPQQWQFPNVSIAAGGYLLVFASGKDRRVAGQELHTNFTLENTGEFLALVNGSTIVSQFSPAFPAQLENVSYGLLTGAGANDILVDEEAPLKVHVPTSAILGTTWTGAGFNDASWTAGTSGVGYERDTSGSPLYNSYFNTDVNALMPAAQARDTIYIRVPFTVVDASLFTSLTLKMRYDDGFVAYLNGTEITRKNFGTTAPLPTPAFSSAATSTHSDTLAVQYESIPVSAFLSSLVSGNNVLAIHGLNQSNNRNDFLISPLLEGNRTGNSTQNYFTAPTPLAANVASAPQVADTNFSVDRGFYDAPFQVAIATATAGAQIRYTLDGSVPTATTGNVYTSPITINTTRTLRAAAFKAGLAPSDVDTQTYIFLNNVIQQNGTGLQPVAPWGHDTNGDEIFDPDWEMDPEIVNNPQWSGTIKDDLKSIATVSLTMPWNDWFGPGGQGIYISGSSIERAVSFELFSADGSENYQQNAAVEIQGGSSDDRWKSDKLSLEVKFKAPYGPTKFDAPLFNDPILDEGATNRYDRFILDAVLNFAWHYGGNVEVPFQRDAAKYIQDQVVADMQNLMGGAAPHGRFVHVYLNGLYWGMYYLHEKPDESFAEEYLGGDKDDYDVLKHTATTVVQGATAVANYAAMLNLVRQNMTVDANYNAVLQKLDLDAFIDYMIINQYSGNTDWAHHNWYASFNRVDPTGKWRFHSWDAEHVFKSLNETAVFTDNSTGTPGEIHTRLMASSEYRLRFADRVQKHFFNGGVLTTANATALYDMRADQIDRAIVGESARWGDNQRSVPYTRNDWRATQDSMLANYFSSRSDFVVNQYLNRSLFSAVNAANYSQFGGTVNSGTQITLSKTANTPAGAQIFWTTDGSDPRFSPNFTTGNAVVTINGALQLKARVLSNGVWSAMTDATFLLTDPFSVRVVEMNYHPADHAGVLDADDIEWIELQNIGTAQVNLKNVKIDTGINYQFSPTVDKFLQPGERIVIARDRNIFQQVYGNSVHLATGAYTQRLDNSTDTVRLLGPLGEILQTITYFDSGDWPGRSDGKGSSLEIVNPTGDPSDSENWRPSYEYAGTPGTAGLGAVNRVVVNEVLTHTDLPQVDAIELYNTTAASINIGGWYLTDTHTNYKKFKIPVGTILGAGQYLVFTEADFNAASPVGGNVSFVMSSEGDDVYLLSPGVGLAPFYAFEDRVEFGAAINGESFGRWPNGTGELFPMKSLTLGAANSGPRIGPVVISEIMYNPTAGNADLEFVELTNLTNQPVALSANYAGVGNVSWKFDGITFAFPAGTVIPANGKLVVVHFNPTLPADSGKRDAFLAEYQLQPTDVTLVGEFTGALDNAGEPIQLLRPDAPDSATPTVVPFVLIDEVDYGNATPWPSPNQATKQSLTRWTAALYGNDPANWNAAVANPGTSDLYAPKVQNVFVNGTGWSQTYRDYLAGLGLGSSQFGFAIPTGANQTADLAWGNINRISIQFDESVTIAQANLELEGTLAGTIAFSGFTYDPATRTATWSLASPLAADQLQLTLSSNVVDAVSHPLDGEWTNNASSFASGDGLPGGNFVFDVHVSAVVPNVGRGDFNLDGTTDGGDITAMLRALTDLANYQSTRGLNATDLKFIADLNGDQLITNRDIQALLNLIASSAGSGSLANESAPVQTGAISSVTTPPPAATAIVVATPSSGASTAVFTSTIVSTNKLTTVARSSPALVQSITLQAPRLASTPRPVTLSQTLKLPTAPATITQRAAVDAALGEWSMLRSRHLRWGPSPQAEKSSEELFAAWS